jgi:hypothetical protein
MMASKKKEGIAEKTAMPLLFVLRDAYFSMVLQGAGTTHGAGHGGAQGLAHGSMPSIFRQQQPDSMIMAETARATVIAFMWTILLTRIVPHSFRNWINAIPPTFSFASKKKALPAQGRQRH